MIRQVPYSHVKEDLLVVASLPCIPLMFWKLLSFQRISQLIIGAIWDLFVDQASVHVRGFHIIAHRHAKFVENTFSPFFCGLQVNRWLPRKPVTDRNLIKLYY